MLSLFPGLQQLVLDNLDGSTRSMRILALTDEHVSSFFIEVNLFWQSLARTIHEDSASRIHIAKQVARSPEERGPPRDEGELTSRLINYAGQYTHRIF